MAEISHGPCDAFDGRVIKTSRVMQRSATTATGAYAAALLTSPLAAQGQTTDTWSLGASSACSVAGVDNTMGAVCRARPLTPGRSGRRASGTARASTITGAVRMVEAVFFFTGSNR